MTPFLHYHQPCLRSEDQWFSWDFQNDLNHWIFHRSQQKDKLWPLDHGGNNQKPTICKGNLLHVPQIPADCSGTQAD